MLSEWVSESHSVLSDSLWSHGLYSPWNSPGPNTGVGRLSLLQGVFPTRDWTQVSHIAGGFFTKLSMREVRLWGWAEIQGSSSIYILDSLKAVRKESRKPSNLLLKPSDLLLVTSLVPANPHITAVPWYHRLFNFHSFTMYVMGKHRR